MKLFKHPVTYFVIGAACIAIGAMLDVRPDDPAGIVFGVLIGLCIVMGILTGTGIIFKK